MRLESQTSVVEIRVAGRPDTQTRGDAGPIPLRGRRFAGGVGPLPRSRRNADMPTRRICTETYPSSPAAHPAGSPHTICPISRATATGRGEHFLNTGGPPADSGVRLDRGDHERTCVVSSTFDPDELQAALDTVHRAGVPGAFAEVRDGEQIWRGAAGVADLATGRPITADMRHRVGSITKTFTATAVLQLVEAGEIGLDTPIGHYLPRLVPGERGAAITVAMLINHTSGLAEYLPARLPVARRISESGEDNAEKPGRQQVHPVRSERADRAGRCRTGRRRSG